VPIETQENGERLAIPDRVWTGTRAGGMKKGAGGSQFCSNWFNAGLDAAAAGVTFATDGEWTENETVECLNSARLYCFEMQR
jgi:hypothetical protein